jgi:hypothetical protein
MNKRTHVHLVLKMKYRTDTDSFCHLSVMLQSHFTFSETYSSVSKCFEFRKLSFSNNTQVTNYRFKNRLEIQQMKETSS